MSAWLGLSVALLLPSTYSIVAVDNTDGTIGAAGASCVGSHVIRILGYARGEGVVHAQAYMNPAGRDRAAQRLAEGTNPTLILQEITSAGFDPDAARRQYGLADRQGRHAAFTGEGTGPYANHQSGFDGRYAWAVQGNLLTGAPVLERTTNRFLAGACDLPERLLSAMEAGAENGEGDARCTPNGLPADSAFLVIIAPEGPEQDLVLVADEATTESPLVSLRRQLETWRLSHPCMIVDAGTDAAPAPDSDGGARTDTGPVDSDRSDGGRDVESAGSCQNVAAGGGPFGLQWGLALFALLAWSRGQRSRAASR